MWVARQLLSRTNALRQCRFYASGIPELTQDRYNVKRGNYSKLGEPDLKFFEKVVGAKHMITDPSELSGYNSDFWKSAKGDGRLVLKPKSTEEVSAILAYCNERKLAVCPQGGNTGLVGGGVPVFDEIIISLQNLNKIESIDDLTGILICQSGCILENLEHKANELGLCVPLDLGAKSSCHIGGNVSTNAGGLRLLRYGNLHGSVLGVEAVLADGKVMDLMSNFKKDNTGYHLKHMFIGSEGTLGIVTKVAMQLAQMSKSVHVAFLGLPSFDKVLETFKMAKQDLGEILSACELIDEKAYQSSITKCDLQAPIPDHPFYMLIETSGSNGTHDEEKLNNFLLKCFESGNVLDGTIASEPSKIQKIWDIRELIPIALLKDGYTFAYDVSIPLRSFYDIVEVMRERVGDLATYVCGYGHLGDSNLHVDVACREFSQELYKRVEPFIFEYTASLKGSISAEHGIGFLKSQYLRLSKSPEAIEMMKDLKTLLDPKGILNPYKILRD
ncbi:D-2-hydroxyglutarate dehydrogenase, mitochondrial isoform X2 [Hermetia illucens]|nr:D-2-hydroxyglutarate dehydrogenase, mitochondrial isoform X2 [Hermetia illucens]